MERQASFFMTGGMVAVHAPARDRHSIWNALKQREVYGTSGPRILLWFDLLNGPAGNAPMGSEVALDVAPHFRVRAVGSFRQLPGCPELSTAALGADRLEKLCRGECYHPSDERRVITRIEVVRVRPQARPGEPVDALIEDPWRRIDCPRDPAGCAVEFNDPDFVAGGRETITTSAPSRAERCGERRSSALEYDAEGNCGKANPCYGIIARVRRRLPRPQRGARLVVADLRREKMTDGNASLPRYEPSRHRAARAPP